MPGITGRFREQIEKRKLLWQKGKEMEKVVDNKPVAAATPAGTSSKTTKVWETTTFAQDSDGKLIFKYFMIIFFIYLFNILINKLSNSQCTTQIISKKFTFNYKHITEIDKLNFYNFVEQIK